MKSLPKLIFIWSCFLMSSCEYEDEFTGNAYCDYPTGERVTEQKGRMYRWSDPVTGKFFYYLGNPDPSLRHGGFVPCNNFPNALIPENDTGVLVVYSGIIKLGKNAEEPLYFGIELTSIIPAE